MAVETHVLFQEAEEMLNGEAPQVHPAQVLGGDIFWTCPEQPQGTFVTWCSVFLQELDTDNGTHDFGKPLEMQFMPAIPNLKGAGKMW